MKNRLILFIITIFLLAASSCRKSSQINPDSHLKLDFSADTILFDTVFTSLGSATHELRIYNRHSDDLKISSIRLAKGDSSPFRFNLDGESATEIYDKIIPAEDSLFSFMRVTINPNDLNTPFVVEDELEFITNGNTQIIKLLAWGQNANYIVADKLVVLGDVPYPYHIVADSLQTTVWTKERPYVIYGWALINSYGTLKIEEGTRIYCHQGGGIFSWSDGQLIIEGTAEEPVVIQGDRLEPYYQDTPGQWEQILMMDGRAGADHRISHAIIRNGTIGLNCQSSLKVTECALRIDNTVIENQSGYGLYSILYPVEAKNFVIANCGFTNFWAFGGDYRFVHGTIANYWNANEHNNNENAVLVMNYALDANEEIFYYPFHMEMDNCIVYGKQKDEFKGIFGPDAHYDSTYIFDHCLIKSEKYNGDMAGFSHCLFNLDPCFADPMKPDCHIDSIASPVIGMGNPLFGNEVPLDLDGVSRVGVPDMGAYQYVP
ncbi:MAG: hypothetical protein K6G25_10210 [Bacteroidales bacterium]|nr:hypothetical protein [Bacteroidales bacterium]